MLSSRATVVTVMLAAALAVGAPGRAAADPEPEATADGPDLSYLFDGGALPFIWGTLGARLALDRWATPATTPQLFSAREGGAVKSSWEVPGWGVSLVGLAVGAAMIGSGDSSRWYHLKGLAESLSTGVFATGVLKVTFGRHRPYWDPAIDDPASRQSFTSGHSTQAWAIATYSILYLRRHVFDDHRRSALSLGEGLAYAGIIGLATAVSAERVIHNRHYVSDVVSGAVLGAATSALFFWYQERRYQHAKDRREDSFSLLPSVSKEGVSVQLGWTF